MNPEKKERLIAAIRSEKYELDMTSWRAETHCGTAACIGGHCLLLMGVECGPWNVHPGRVAAKWLEVTPSAAIDLFHPSGLRGWEKITRDDAILAIENVAEYGDPYWKVIRPDLVKETA